MDPLETQHPSKTSGRGFGVPAALANAYSKFTPSSSRSRTGENHVSTGSHGTCDTGFGNSKPDLEVEIPDHDKGGSVQLEKIQVVLIY